MDTDLKRIRRLLRADRCPPEVVQRVRQTIKAERRQVQVRRLAYACAILIALAASLASFHSNRDQKLAKQRKAKALQERITQQASLSLAYIGQQLQETGSDTGEKILRGTVPGLTKGLYSVGKAFSKEPSNSLPPQTEPKLNQHHDE